MLSSLRHEAGWAHFAGFASLLQNSVSEDKSKLPVASLARLHSFDSKSFSSGPRLSSISIMEELKGAAYTIVTGKENNELRQVNITQSHKRFQISQ